jgi:hypothetical protein
MEEPSEESGGLPLEVDAWETEASPGPVFGNDRCHRRLQNLNCDSKNGL